MNLVVIPFHDWKKCEQEGFRTRDAHFMQEFGRHPDVEKMLVINRPISLAEMLLYKRRATPARSESIWHKRGVYLSRVSPKIFTLDIVVPQLIRPLRMKRHWTPWIFGRSGTITAVNQAIHQLGMSQSWNLFTSAPLFAPLVRHLSPHFWAFDAQDNLLRHASYRTVPALAEYYDYCLQHAGFISANSAETTRWFQQTRPDAEWIPNGVDTEMFSARKQYRRPADMQDIAPPVVGYAGKMQEMVDREMVRQALTAFPQVNFVFIGQQLDRDWVKPLWEYPNAHYLGDKPYQQLPHYLAAFDICTIPYNTERQHGGDPIKFYEYLAMGKPVVSAEIGNVGMFRDYPQVGLANTPEQFVAAIRHFLTLIQAGSPPEVRPVPSHSLWKTKAGKIIRAMGER